VSAEPKIPYVYDGYGRTTVYKSPEPMTSFLAEPHRSPGDAWGDRQHRFIVWVSYTPTSGTALRKTYRTQAAAFRVAKRWERKGYSVEVRDRTPLPGDFGHIAGSGSRYVRAQYYYMTKAGTLLTGDYENMEAVRRLEAEESKR
jgi:hypothetical protein